MDSLNKARKMFDRHMNGTSRDVSGWLTDLGPKHEEINDKLTGESGRLIRIPGTNRAELFVKSRPPGTWMLVLASVLLLALAVAQGYVSYRAQFTFIHSAGKGQVPATLEALGLDAAAAIFAFLGLAKARRGKSSPHIERALNIACAFGSGFMNLLGADLASPRSVAVFILPPLLYAATSDRLIAVVANAYGISSGSMWKTAGKLAGAAALYCIRLPLAPVSTARGFRCAILNATPLPEPQPKVIVIPRREPRRQIGPRKPKAITGRPESKRSQFLSRVTDKYGGLAGIELESTARIANELHGDLHEGQARTDLRNAVKAARDEAK